MLNQVSKIARDPRTRHWSFLLLLAGVLLSWFGAYTLERREQQKAQFRFSQLIDRVEQEILMRFERPVSGLRSMVGFYAGSDHISRKDFQDYWSARDIGKEFTGVRAFGYMQRVPRKDLAAFIASERRDGAPDFDVKYTGLADELFVIKLIEPLASNRAARGLVASAEAIRNEALQRGIRTGEPALSGVIELVQDAQKSPGFVYAMPIFRKGTKPETEEARRAHVTGMAFMPLLARDLLEPLLAQTQGLTHFELYEGASPSAQSLVYRSNLQLSEPLLAPGANPATRAKKGPRTQSRQLYVGGRSFTLFAASTGAFDDSVKDGFPVLVGVGGVLLSLFAALSLGLLLQGRSDAQDQAKLIYQDLLAERRRLSNIIAGTDAGTWELDMKTWENRIDARWADILGYTLEEIEPVHYEKWQSLVHPDDLAEGKRQMQSHIDGHSDLYQRELRVRHRNGHWVWVQSRARISERASDGRALKVSGIHLDISARKAAELSLADVTTQLQSVLDAATEVAIIATNRDKIITVFNPGAEAMLGYRAQDVVGKQTRALFHDPDEMQSRAQALQALNQEPVQGLGVFVAQSVLGKAQQWTCIRQDGSRFTASEVVTEIRNPAGELLGYLSLTQDITQQKAYEASLQLAKEQAEQATLAKGQFLANMSHEIRTPMNAILGMLKLLHRTPLSPQQLDYASKTETAAQSLLGLINDILDFSKVEAGKMTLDVQAFALDQLMRDLAVVLSANVDNKPIEVLFDIDPVLPERLLGDALRLQQVLINLAGNAVKFTYSGSVVLRLHLQEMVGQTAHVLFSVQDTGIGIAAEHMAHIFDGFSQAESSTTRRFGGTGLGLAICKRLVEMMQGTLQVQSQLGVGSTFSFTLPLQCPPALPSQGAAQADPPARALHTLVVDDNPIACELMRTMLGSLGWQAEAVSSGAQAIERVRQAGVASPYDVIFIDWQMPVQDGWETARALRKLTTALGAPQPSLLMVTAHARDMHTQRTARELSLLDGFLFKPVTASILRDAVSNAQSPSSALQASKAQESGKPRLPGLRVLLVEDNLINQQVAQELLSLEGAQVTVAVNGQLGVEAVAAASVPFDAVLMDLQMPVLDGFAATRAIRQRLGHTDLPVIAMTANALESDRQACLAAGMNDHIGKPFELNQLVNALLHHTGRQAASTRETPTPPSDQPNDSQTLDNEPLEKTRGQSDDLDIESALKRMGGHVNLYRQALASFVQELALWINPFEACLAQGRTEEAARQLHTLKGLAATLGARKLSAFAAQAEGLLKNNETMDGTARLQTQAHQAIEEARRALQAVLHRLVPPASSASAASAAPGPEPMPTAMMPETTLALHRLSSLLQASDLSATLVFEQLRSQQGAALGTAQPTAWAALQTAIESLDFARAHAECASLLNNLNT
jgi:PAS domain S-box-containing protein